VVGANISVTQGDVLIDFPDRSSGEVLKACEDVKAAAQNLLATVERIPRLGQKKANARADGKF
jgi:ethanolamine utilization microcompartment shell protein EutS